MTEFPTFKIVLIGDTNVGKTCLIERFINDRFIESSNTIANKGYKKNINVSNKEITLDVWDTAGQEQFRSVAPLSYRNASAILMTFSSDIDKSLDNLDYWQTEVRKSFGDSENKNIFIVLTKSDLIDEVKGTELIAKAKEKYIDYKKNNFFKTSSKTGEGVKELFDEIGERLLLSPQNSAEQVKIDQDNDTKNDKCSC